MNKHCVHSKCQSLNALHWWINTCAGYWRANRVLFLALRLVLFLLVASVYDRPTLSIYFLKSDQTLHGKCLFLLLSRVKQNMHGMCNWYGHKHILHKEPISHTFIWRRLLIYYFICGIICHLKCLFDKFHRSFEFLLSTFVT